MNRPPICNLELFGSTSPTVRVLTGPGNGDFARNCFARGRWQFFADNTFLFTPGAAADVRDDLYPLPGFFRREAHVLIFHGTRHSPLGASAALVGFVADVDKRPHLDALGAASSATVTKVVVITQALSLRPDRSDAPQWPPIPSTFEVTLTGRVGNTLFGPLAGVLALRARTEGDSNPFALRLESRESAREGSLAWNSFLTATEIKMQFMTLSTEPDRQVIEARLLPGIGGSYAPLGASWCHLHQVVGRPDLPHTPDWITAEEAVLQLRLRGNQLSGELTARGPSRAPRAQGDLTYEASLTGHRLAEHGAVVPPSPSEVSVATSSFTGSWGFERWGRVTFHQAGTMVQGTLGDGRTLSGQASGPVLAWRWDDQQAPTGLFLLLANPRQLAGLVPQATATGWETALGTPLDELPLPRPVISESSRQELKHRGYDLVLEGRCAEAVGFLEEAIALYHRDRELGDRLPAVRDSSLIDEINILIRLCVCYQRLRRFDGLLSALRQQVEIIRLLAACPYLDGTAGAPGFADHLADNLELYRRQMSGDLEKIQTLDASRAFFEELVSLLLELDQVADALLASEKSRARAFADLLAAQSQARHLPEGHILSAGATVPLSKAILQSGVAGSRSVVVEYLITDRQLIIWVVAPKAEPQLERVATSRGDLVRSIETLLGLLGSLHPTPRHGEPSDPRDIAPADAGGAGQRKAAMTRALQQLHELLIEPILHLLPPDPGARVTIVPHGALFFVPFPALLDDQELPLLSRFTLTMAPSIGTLVSLAQPANHGFQPGEILVVGNPQLPSAWGLLAPLRGAEEEARRVSEHFHARPLIGAAATKDAVVAAMPAARLVHLACHGLLDHGDGSELPGALVLGAQSGDGLLTSGEIASLRLSADLVVLSACKTGLGRVTGDGVLGLARAFLTAGAKGVMVSLWSVDDASTALLMTELYRHLLPERDRAAALRQAMLTTRASYPAPESWAAFTFIGLEPATAR